MEHPPDEVGTASLPAAALESGAKASSWVWDVLCCFLSFTGRIDRRSWWTVISTASVVLVLTSYCLVDVRGPIQHIRPVAVVVWFVMFAAATVKRAHDFEESGWWVLSLVLVAPLMFLAFGRGVPWASRFGAPPPGWMRVGRRGAAGMAEVARLSAADEAARRSQDPRSIALAQRFARTRRVKDAQSLIRHIGGRVESDGFLSEIYKLHINVAGRWEHFRSEDDFVQWVLAEIVPAILNRPAPNPFAS